MISNSGRSRDLIDSADIVRKKGATLIVITASDSPLAQMTLAEKNQSSHRYRALLEMREMLLRFGLVREQEGAK